MRSLSLHAIGSKKSELQTLRVHRRTGTDQGLRNHALLAALLGSGLRVSEILNLERDQYTGKGFSRVRTKGGAIRDFDLCRYFCCYDASLNSISPS